MLFSRVQKFKYCHFLLEKNDMLVGPYLNLPYGRQNHGYLFTITVFKYLFVGTKKIGNVKYSLCSNI